MLKILYVEDDYLAAAATILLLKEEFEQEGCSVVHVPSLSEALKAIETTRFNAVLLDLELAKTKGTFNVGAIVKASSELPIVVLTAHDSNQTALSAIRHGAQEYIVKTHMTGRSLGLAVRASIERKAYERQLFRQAHSDELTGLPNRRMFLDYMPQILARAQRRNRREAVMFMDINGFKKVNDGLGHDVGDTLLKQIATRLKASLRASDMLARVGGDEFVLHLDTETSISEEACRIVAEKLSAALAEPFMVGDYAIRSGASIGIAFYPEHGETIEELIQNADQAMYRAKKAGAGHAFCE